MVEHKVEQLSPEWFDLRRGKLTGSKFKDIMPSAKPKAKWTKGHLTMLREVASERLTGITPETYQSKDMQWGNDNEEAARQLYSDIVMAEVRESGFWEVSEWVGDSPDGICEPRKEALEIKCPSSKTHLLYLLDSEELWKEYMWQCLGHCLCTGLRKVALVSYDPRMPEGKQIVIYRPSAEDVLTGVALLEARLQEAVVVLKEMVA